MKSINAIKKENAQIRGRRMEATVMPYKGRFGFESNLIMRLGMVSTLAQEMFEALAQYSSIVPDKNVLELLDKYNQFLLQSERANATGEYIEDATPKGVNQKKEAVGLSERIFGMTWEELEKRQGGKLT